MDNFQSKGNGRIMICLLLLVFLMLFFVSDEKKWGPFCGSVAILYTILVGRSSKE
jgi:hypothetical protein